MAERPQEQWDKLGWQCLKQNNYLATTGKPKGINVFHRLPIVFWVFPTRFAALQGNSEGRRSGISSCKKPGGRGVRQGKVGEQGEGRKQKLLEGKGSIYRVHSSAVYIIFDSYRARRQALILNSFCVKPQALIPRSSTSLVIVNSLSFNAASQGISHHCFGLRSISYRQQRGIRLVQRLMRKDLENSGTQCHCHQLQLFCKIDTSNLLSWWPAVYSHSYT